MEKAFVKHISALRPYCLIAMLACIVFLPGLGAVHLFDWDELNFAEAAREMLVTHNYTQVQINFKPFYEKPPLFFWLQLASMKLWGVNEWAARFPNVLFCIFTGWTLYYLGQKERGVRFALFWALMHFGALLPHFYFKTGIIDPVFNYFMLVGFYCLVKLLTLASHTNRLRNRYALVGGLALGLAVLTKGPVGYVLPGLPVILYSLSLRQLPIVTGTSVALLAFGSLVIPLGWLGYETIQHGGTFIKAFLHYQIALFSEPVAGHGQPFYYHFLVLFFGCFPASVLALQDLWKISLKNPDTLYTLMQLLCWVVIILFSLVTTKIVHYSSMAYFPISFLGAHRLYQLAQKKAFLPRQQAILFLSVGLLLAMGLIALPLAALYRSIFYPCITDPFIVANLSLPVPWAWSDTLPGVLYGMGVWIAYCLVRKGAFIPFLSWCSVVTAVSLGLATQQIVPKIEMHLQGPVVAFYKSLVGQPVYVTTLGFKSYAPFFYFQQPRQGTAEQDTQTWLLTGAIEKPAYFVLKTVDKPMMQAYKDVHLVATVGGFCFFKRMPPNSEAR